MYLTQKTEITLGIAKSGIEQYMFDKANKHLH